MRLSYCRARLLFLIGDGERSATDLAAETRRLQTNVSRDLRLMEKLGLVTGRPGGTYVYYRKAGT